MGSISLVMTDCLLTGRGQGHVSKFYILDFVATASRWFTDDINELIDDRLANHTYNGRAPVPDVSCARPPARSIDCPSTPYGVAWRFRV